MVCKAENRLDVYEALKHDFFKIELVNSEDHIEDDDDIVERKNSLLSNLEEFNRFL